MLHVGNLSPGACAMKRVRPWIGLPLLLLVPLFAQGQTELRFKLKPKDFFVLETTSQLQQTVKASTQEFKQDVTYKTRTRYTVLEAGPEGTVLEMKIEAYEATLPGGKPTPTAVRSELKDATLRLKLDAQQQVAAVEGFTEFLQQATGGDTNLNNAMQMMLSEENLRKVAQQAFAYLPGKPVKPGDSWERPLTVPLGPLGAFEVTNTYTLEQPEKVQNKLCQRIAVACKVKYIAPKNLNLPFTIQSGEFTATEGKGMIWFDAHVGELVRSELKLALQGTLKVETQGKASTIELKQKQVVEVRKVFVEE
jgi:hypothetical protein